MIDPITESDLAAYVDGELDAMRRLEVEAHLARHPEDAARVMADLRDRDALRGAFPRPAVESERLRAAARRIDRALAWQCVGARLRRVAVIAMLVGAGWLAHTEFGTFASPADPTLAEAAQQARHAVQIRARTASQRAIPSYDRADLEAATGLDLPDLPADWTVRDVQVFPSRTGTEIEVEIHAGPLGEVALFAVRSAEEATPATEVARTKDGTTVFWRTGRMAYALTGHREVAELAAATARLSTRY